MHAVCGSVTQVLEVSEPEKCEYMATMSTPAECTDKVVQEVWEELEELKLLSAAPADDVKDEL